MEGGPQLDSVEQAGLANLTAQMMNESTTERSVEELSLALDMLGSSVSFSTNSSYTIISVNSLTKNLDATLDILQEKLFKPAFLEADFERLKQQNLQSLQNANKEANHLMSKARAKLLYGDQRKGLLNDGTISTVDGLTLDDVKAFYAKYYNPAKANVIVVGDISEQQALTKLSFVNDWQVKAYDIPESKPFPALDTTKLYFVNKEGAAQSVINVVRHALAYDSTGEYFKNNLMNFSLGGTFNSRINMNLREDKGYTYGAWSGFSGAKKNGIFRVSTSVKKDNTLDSLNEILMELNAYHSQGMNKDEFDFMRSAYSQSEALDYETPGKKAGFLRRLVTYGLDKSYVDEQNKKLADVTVDELNQQAAKWLNAKEMAIIVVGDEKTVKPQLKELGMPVVDLELVD